MMRKFLLSTALTLMMWSTVEAATIDLGTSEIYSPSERNDAVKKILFEFNGWEGCEMHSIKYAGDQCNTQKNIDWLNDLSDGRKLDLKFDHCMEFVSNFHSPKEQYGAWNPDAEYENWQWWLGRDEKGDWYLLSWGY